MKKLIVIMIMCSMSFQLKAQSDEVQQLLLNIADCIDAAGYNAVPFFGVANVNLQGCNLLQQVFLLSSFLIEPFICCLSI